MPARLEEAEEDSAFIPYHDGQYKPYCVKIGNAVFMLVSCAEQAAAFTRMLNAAGDEKSFHNAMNILCHQMYLSEDIAKRALMMLKASEYENPASWDYSSKAMN